MCVFAGSQIESRQTEHVSLRTTDMLLALKLSEEGVNKPSVFAASGQRVQAGVGHAHNSYFYYSLFVAFFLLVFLLLAFLFFLFFFLLLIFLIFSFKSKTYTPRPGG